MRKTFADDIEKLIRYEVSSDESDFDALQALLAPTTKSNNDTFKQLLAGNYATVFKARSYLPVTAALQHHYTLMTQYVSKLALFKELCEKAETDVQKETCKNLAKELYNPSTIQQTFNNIPIDEALQTLNLLQRIHNNHAWLGNKQDGMPLRQIGREILNTACENPTFYQQEPGGYIYPNDTPKQLSNFCDFIKNDKVFIHGYTQRNIFTKKLIKGTQATYNNIKSSENYRSKQALLAGILTTWEKSKDYLTDDDIYWLKASTGHLKKEYQIMPSVLQEILGFCKRALSAFIRNPWPTTGMLAVVGGIIYTATNAARSISSGYYDFIRNVQKLESFPKPLTEDQSKKMAFVYSLARLWGITPDNLNERAQQATTPQEADALLTQANYMQLATVTVLTITLLGQYKNTPAPTPLPDWVNEWENRNDVNADNEQRASNSM